MIVINGRITVDPARRADLVAAAIAMQEASRAEEGCLHYVFSADLSDDTVFHIAEKWASDDILKAHFATPHMAAFGKATAGAVKGMEIMRYEVASESKLR